MTKGKIHDLEMNYQANRKKYLQQQDAIKSELAYAKRRRANLMDYILTIYRDVDLIYAKPFLSELEQNEEQMNKVYQKQIEEIEHQMLEEKKEIKGIKLEQSFQVLGFKRKSEGKKYDRVFGVITSNLLDLSKTLIDLEAGIVFDSYVINNKILFPNKIYKGVFVVPRFGDGEVRLQLIEVLD